MTLNTDNSEITTISGRLYRRNRRFNEKIVRNFVMLCSLTINGISTGTSASKGHHYNNISG